MAVRHHVSLLACTLMALAGSGCSQQANPAKPSARPTSEAVPTEADRRAAKLLSLSNNSTLELVKDPYDKAVSCVVAIDVLGARLDEGNVLNAEQKNALQHARSLYASRALAAGDRSARDLAREVEAQRAEADDMATEARTAMSCIRELT